MNQHQEKDPFLNIYKKAMTRILALDTGTKRIGVALSDETQTIASGIETINAESTKNAVTAIRGLVEKHNVVKVVVGLPINMNGSKGPAASKVLKFCDKLKEELSLDVTTFDERLTTAQGEAIMLQQDISRFKRKKRIDKLAAQILLQAYLDSEKNRRE